MMLWYLCFQTSNLHVTKLSVLGQSTWYMYIVSQKSIMVIVKVSLLVNDGISHVP